MRPSDSIRQKADLIAPALEQVVAQMHQESERRDPPSGGGGGENEAFVDDQEEAEGIRFEEETEEEEEVVEIEFKKSSNKSQGTKNNNKKLVLWEVEISRENEPQMKYTVTTEEGNGAGGSGGGGGLAGFLWRKGSSRVAPEEQANEKSSIADAARKQNTQKSVNLPVDIEDGDDDDKRQQWSNPIEFLLSCIAMSVGLGNVWRFPFTAYENGGGAFLFPYIVVLLVIGRPLYFLELAMGQFSSSSSAKVWNMVPAVRGVGYGQVIANAAVVTYYSSLIALAIYYLAASFQGTLPWMVCDPDIQINGTICVEPGTTMDEAMKQLNDSGTYIDPAQNYTPMGSAEQYFLHSVLKEKPNIDDGLGLPGWQLVTCLFVCYVLLFFTLWQGVASSGKVAYFTALFPYVVLITLAIKAVTLEGSGIGIKKYFTPDFDKLFSFEVWYAAVTQSFFSLSVGFGSIITYSSYNEFRHNTYRDALIISLTDTFTSMLAGFVIFGVLGNLAHELGVEVDEVVKSGTGLAFISYPMAIGKFAWYPQLFAVLFFLMLITLGMGSATGLITGVITVVCDDFPSWNKTLVTGVICFAGFAIGIVYVTPGGQYIVELVDYYGGGFIIFVLATLEVVAVSWIYGLNRFIRDIRFMLDRTMGCYWRTCWGFVIPVALLAMFFYQLATFEPVEYSGQVLPLSAQIAGLVLVAVALLQVPYWLLYAIFIEKGETCKEKIFGAFSPNAQWGPRNLKLRAQWQLQETEYQMNRLRRLQDRFAPKNSNTQEESNEN